MQEEAADELVGVETHHLGLVAVGVVAPPEADVLPVELDETVVADGGLVGVAPEIGQHLAGAGERGLGIDHPVVRSFLIRFTPTPTMARMGANRI